MARNTSLLELVTMVREESGRSTSPALGQNTATSIRQMIRRTQEVLWLQNTWRHLEVERDITTAAGQRYYAYPTDLSLNHRIINVHVKNDDDWQPVLPGIDLCHYNISDPENDEREDPVCRWQMFEENQVELWPLPATDDITIRFKGIRNLRPLVADTDTADLDDYLIALYCAAEILGNKNEAGKQKLSIAQDHLKKLIGTLSNSEPFRMGAGGRGRESYQRPAPLYGRKL